MFLAQEAGSFSARFRPFENGALWVILAISFVALAFA